jgi:tetratricopeptide (TPR) repeat protein
METSASTADARQGLMRLAGALAVAAALAACAPADPAVVLAQNLAACETGAFPEQRMAACSAVAADTGATAQQRAAALIQRGMSRAAEGHHTRAVADFGRALRLDPANSDALSERGAVHQERGAYDLAMRDYEAALAIDPQNSMASYRREQAMTGRMDAVQQQLAQLTEVLTRDPENATALNNRCWLRAVNDDDLNAALADCNAALRIEPESANALDSRALVYLKRGEFAAALADYDAALALEPRRGHYVYGRGLARVGLGQAEGQADLASAEALEPGVTAAYAGYGHIPDTPASAATAGASTAGGTPKP